MRMWMVNPEFLCDKHLLGEHGEIHKHRHNFVKQHRVDGRLFPVVQIEPGSMQTRHDSLAEEMVRRGMKHNSPFVQPGIGYLPGWQQEAKVDVNESLADLSERCPKCREKIFFK